VFVTDVRNSQEITHEKSLIGCEDTARNFVRTMQGLGNKLGRSSSRLASRSRT